MKLAATLTVTIALLAAALLAGCGGDGDSGSDASATTAPPAQGSSAPQGATAKDCQTGSDAARDLHVTGIGCEKGRQLLRGWQQSSACATPGGASRSSCKVSTYRCLTAVTERGLSVSCAQPGRSFAFLARPE